MQELGYKSKKRKTKKSSKIKHIGYIVTKNEYSFDDTYFSEIIKGIEAELSLGNVISALHFPLRNTGNLKP